MSKLLTRAASVLLALGTLSGCATVGLSAAEVVPPTPTGLIADALAVHNAATAAGGVTAINVAELGYATVSNSCDAYFSALIKANNRVQLTKADLSAPQERARHSTVTLLARLRGLSTSVPRAHAV